MLNKTDFHILGFCSSKFSHLSASEISKGIAMHITTVSERLNLLFKLGYLIRKKSGRGFIYRFNFDAGHARAFRVFIDADFINSLNIEKLNGFIKANRENQNIVCCLVYGSSLKTKRFNDIDLLIVYDKEQIKLNNVFDVFQMDAKTFRNLYSLGEPRLHAALTTGRVLIDRSFIFSYFENDLPIRAADEIVNQLDRKYFMLIDSVQGMKKENDIREKILDALQMKGVIEFVSNKKPIPTKTEFDNELKKINQHLHQLILKVRSAKGVKQLWDIFYSEIL